MLEVRWSLIGRAYLRYARLTVYHTVQGLDRLNLDFAEVLYSLESPVLNCLLQERWKKGQSRSVSESSPGLADSKITWQEPTPDNRGHVPSLQPLAIAASLPAAIYSIISAS